MTTSTRPTHEDGIAVYRALCAEHGVSEVEVRWFASDHMSKMWSDLEEIGSSDVSCHLSYLGNYEPDVLRAECERLAKRASLVASVAASTGRSEADTLAALQSMFAREEIDGE